MDLKTKKKLDTVTIYDLMDNHFFIPDYQRGYRWTELEVKKLLVDFEDFFKKSRGEDSFYCLQPLVVFYNKEQDAWEVIDGQQRLTTLFLIINQQRELLERVYPDMKLFDITYQSRPGSKQYLLDLDEDKKDDNIDYYHMYNASRVIKDFLKATELKDWRFVDTIINVNNTPQKPSIKFIWYDVTEEIENKKITSEDKFSDLNIGKIGLTNAELIKALFINNVGEDESEALRIASEWDSIEHSLQNDLFWSFIYGKEDGRYATRIEFLFDVIRNKQLSEQNDFYTFDKYSDEIRTRVDEKRKSDIQVICPEKSVVKDLWKEVSDKYHLYKGWYENKNLYHVVGYLRYKKYDISKIEGYYNNPQIENIDSFFDKLKEEALKTVADVDFRSLNYHDAKDHKKIFDLLTLFNILSIIECEKADVRFSFDEFYKHSWDIEHVRSQTPKEIDGSGRLDWITCTIEYFSGIDYMHCETDEDDHVHYKYQENLSLYIEDVKSVGNRFTEIIPGCTVGYVCDELLTLLDSKSDITKSTVFDILNNQVFKQDSSFRYEDSIGNLVLLDQGTNRGYKNAFFPVKRKWIYRREREGIYILPCTRNVFAKNYSKMIFDLMNWNNEDAEAYMTEIGRVIYNE